MKQESINDAFEFALENGLRKTLEEVEFQILDKLVSQGSTTQQIADLMGIPHTTCFNKLRIYGVGTKQKRTRAQIVDLKKSGLSAKQISEKLRLSEQTIFNKLRPLKHESRNTI